MKISCIVITSPSIPVISSMIPGDYETVRSVYGGCARYVQAFYPIPMDYASLELDGDRGSRKDVTVLVGGIIPDQDVEGLKKIGVAGIFQPGTPMDDIVKFIREHVEPHNVPAV